MNTYITSSLVLITTLSGCGKASEPTSVNNTPLVSKGNKIVLSGTIKVGDNIDDAVKLLVMHSAKEEFIPLKVVREFGEDSNKVIRGYKLYVLPDGREIMMNYKNAFIDNIQVRNNKSTWHPLVGEFKVEK